MKFEPRDLMYLFFFFRIEKQKELELLIYPL